MNRPHRVWLLFALFLALAAGGLGWLTHQTLELNRAEAIARQQAEQEERVGLALWRMDAFLMPLLVQEASRPDFVYSANYLVTTLDGGKGATRRTLSPVLELPPEFVRLHFQLAADGGFTSPQAPQGEERAWSLRHGVTEARISQAQEQLAQLTQRMTYGDLLTQLPAAPPSNGPTAVAEQNPFSDSTLNYAASQQPVVESFAQQQLANLPRDDDASQALPLGGVRGSNFSQSDGNEASQSIDSPTQAATQGNNFLGNRRSQSVARNANTDLSSRNSVFQAYASKASADNLRNLGNTLVVAPLSIEGVSRPLWVGQELILARRVERGGVTFIQGCWLDWPKLSERLRQEVSDVLPQVEFQPAGMGDVARSLATLPVQVIAPVVADNTPTWTVIRLALALAWIGLLIAATAAAVTLYSVIALSERRAAFVAAVTHELRTPLTTFRMYAEMLASGMVPHDKQPTYLETLRSEADRLAHLVDNVLQYARLERGGNQAHRETLGVVALVDRMSSRLASRAEQAGLELKATIAPATGPKRMSVDAAALEQILFNLIDNACKYAAHGADLRLHLDVEHSPSGIVWRVRDHGPGIPAAGQRRLFQPFSKTVQEAAASAPGVGLGLALSQRLARELGGTLRLERSGGDGTVFSLTLPFAPEQT